MLMNVANKNNAPFFVFPLQNCPNPGIAESIPAITGSTDLVFEFLSNNMLVILFFGNLTYIKSFIVISYISFHNNNFLGMDIKLSLKVYLLIFS